MRIVVDPTPPPVGTLARALRDRRLSPALLRAHDRAVLLDAVGASADDMRRAERDYRRQYDRERMRALRDMRRERACWPPVSIRRSMAVRRPCRRARRRLAGAGRGRGDPGDGDAAPSARNHWSSGGQPAPTAGARR